MEYLFEFIIELVLEGSIEVSKNRKIPKYIRYPLIVLISLIFMGVIGLILMVGILALEENVLLGIFFIILGLFMFILCIIKFRKTYLIKIEKK